MSDRTSRAITVISAYRFYMFALAGQLASHNALCRLVTATPRRTVTEVPRELVRARPWLALARHAAARLHLPVDQTFIRLVVRDFDRWAVTQLTDERVVTALSACATSALIEAAKQGARTVCDRGSWHILEQKRVLDAEADRWGWTPIGFDPWIIERELREYDFVDRIFVPSAPAKRSFIRRGIPAERVAKVSFGADLSTFRPADPGHSDPGRVICVAHLGLQKGHQYLVPAYRKVRRPGTSLVLIGNAPAEAVRRLGLPEDDILTTGTVSRPRVAEELRSSGVFTIASVHDGLALVIAQAMASGLPIVATEASGAEELVTDGVEGYVIPTGDGDRLAEALDHLLSNTDEARAMGEAARRRIEGLGGWGEYGRVALDVFGSLLP